MRRLVKPAQAATPARDAFTFSLGGLRTVAGYTAAPAIADDQFQRSGNGRGRPEGAQRGWIPRRRRPAINTCA